MGVIMNLLQTEEAVAGAIRMGYPKESVFYLGVVLLMGPILFAIPKTAIIGVIILTGWLGGAVARHVIHGDSIINILFPVFFGILTWCSTTLKHVKLKALILN